MDQTKIKEIQKETKRGQHGIGNSKTKSCLV